MDVKHRNTISSGSYFIVIIHRPKYNIPMQILQVYKYELKPNGQQVRDMRHFASACRFVSNKALALQKDLYAIDQKSRFSYTKFANFLPLWRKELLWLNKAPSQALQQTIKNLEFAYINLFGKHIDFPRFKKKGSSDSFRYPQGFKLDQENGRVFLPKLGWIRYRNNRDILGRAKNITVSGKGGKWYLSVQTEHEVEQSVHPATSIVGIDVGIARFATLSDGTYIEPLNNFKHHQRRLARVQWIMSYKTKFSNNWTKARTRVQRIHTTIANIRRDFVHKNPTTISKNHALVCIEDLQVKNLSKSAAGIFDAPERNVRAKSSLNRLILDQGWAEFWRQLGYKQSWLDGDVLTIPPRNTSRRCHVCDHTHADNRMTQANFECVECGFAEDADLVGATNILVVGHAVLACGGTVQQGHPMKQESTEAIRHELVHA